MRSDLWVPRVNLRTMQTSFGKWYESLRKQRETKWEVLLVQKEKENPGLVTGLHKKRSFCLLYTDMYVQGQFINGITQFNSLVEMGSLVIWSYWFSV